MHIAFASEYLRIGSKLLMCEIHSSNFCDIYYTNFDIDFTKAFKQCQESLAVMKSNYNMSSINNNDNCNYNYDYNGMKNIKLINKFLFSSNDKLIILLLHIVQIGN